MKLHNILIVDDDEMITTTLSKVVAIMLKQNVLTFNDPVAALEAIVRDRPEIDLVISDFIMPGINGIEFLKRLREFYPDAVSILLTGYSDKQNAIAGINEVGIFHYMEKPWDNEVLVHTIQNGLEKKRLKDELNLKVLELESRNLEIRDLYSRLEEEYQKETQRNNTLEADVAERTASIRNLLDNAGQGFLSFGTDLKIDQDFSLECRRIFGKHIRGEEFSKLLYPDDTEQQAFVSKLAGKVLTSEDNSVSELYIPLLPDSIELNGRSIRIEYKVIRENNFSSQKKLMAVLSDMTEKRELESMIEYEKNLFKMIVKVVTEAHDFSLCIEEFQEFLNRGAEEIINCRDTSRDALNEIFRRVHTIKGNFSMFNMQKTVECLHAAEDRITELQAHKEPISKEDLLFLVGAIDFKSGFDADQSEIRQILGDNYYMSDNPIRINRVNLVELENRMACILKPADFIALVPDVRRLGFRKAGDLLSSYLDYVIVLSERNGKMLKPVSLSGGDTRIDQDLYSGFIRTLIHVFRNSVIHGIETPEERAAKGKDPYGRISCEIKETDDQLEFIISDDGKGIDIEALRERAFQNGLFTREEALALNREEAVSLIFRDSFSTSDSVSMQSGRGVGLSAVKAELEKLGGRVLVQSAVDKGVCFNFIIPRKADRELTPINPAILLKPASEHASKIIGDCINDNFRQIDMCDMHAENGLVLYDHTVFIGIRGQMDGNFFMSFDKGLTEKVMNHCVPELPPENRESLIDETLSEIANIVLGNIMGQLKQHEDYITMETPFAVNGRDIMLNMPASEVLKCKIHFKNGICCVGFVNKW